MEVHSLRHKQNHFDPGDAALAMGPFIPSARRGRRTRVFTKKLTLTDGCVDTRVPGDGLVDELGESIAQASQETESSLDDGV